MTRAEVQFQLGRLMAVYPVPKHFPNDVEKLARIYGDVLEGLDSQAVADAVSKILASDGKFFPTPGQVATAAGHRTASSLTDLGRRYRDWEANGWNRADVSNPDGGRTLGYEPCPVCGELPATSGRLRVIHIEAEHRRLGVGAIGATDEIEQFYATAPKYERPSVSASEAA